MMGVALFRRRDVIAGLLLIVVAAVVVTMAAYYPAGGRHTVGPAVFPMWAAGIVFASGAVITTLGVMGEHILPEWGDLRPAAFIAAAFAVFSLLIDVFGLVPASLAGGFIAGLAISEQTWIGRGLTTVGLTVLASVFFVELLGLPMRLVIWPN